MPPSRKNSAANRAGLRFSVGRVKKAFTGSRTTPDADVFMAAVLENLVANVVDLSGAYAMKTRKKRLVARHIMLAMRNDEDLKKLARNAGFSRSGWLPHVEPNKLFDLELNLSHESEPEFDPDDESETEDESE